MFDDQVKEIVRKAQTDMVRVENDALVRMSRTKSASHMREIRAECMHELSEITRKARAELDRLIADA